LAKQLRSSATDQHELSRWTPKTPGALAHFEGGDAVIVGARLAEKLRLIPGQRITLIAPQAHHLLPEFSALENVMVPQRVAGKSRDAARTEAVRLLKLVGLADRLEHRPSQLSGGEQQRVAIARSLANHLRLLLADEPTGNLDQRTAQGVFDVLVNLVRAEGVAALVATHNLELAAKMDRQLMLHEGRLIESAAPAL